MMRTRALQVVLVLLLAAVLEGCACQPQDSPELHISRGNSVGTTSQVAAESTAIPDPNGSAESRKKSAVLFVAYIATPQDVVQKMLEMARVTGDDVVYDLGCGDGRIVVTAARRYRCRAVGYDLDRLRVQEARRNAQNNRVVHLVTIRRQDILKADLRDATVVTLYMGREMHARMIPLLRTLRPGARIVCHDYGLGDLPPNKVVETTSRADGRKHTLSLWTCPLPQDG